METFKRGLFLKIPAGIADKLLFQGFKTKPNMEAKQWESAYSESFWGTLSKEYQDYNFLLTLAQD